MKMLQPGKKKEKIKIELKHICPHCEAVLLINVQDVKEDRYTDLDGSSLDYIVKCPSCKEKIILPFNIYLKLCGHTTKFI